MFDKFESFKAVKKQSFTFLPKRYEIWQSGKIVKSGKSFLPINAIVVNELGEERVKVIINDKLLYDEISTETLFDAFISQVDRLQLITIPAVTNADCTAISGNRMMIGSTRQEKNFGYKDAYCCNLFMEKGILKKITFAFSNPSKLIEFYQDGEEEVSAAVLVAKAIITLLIEDYDSDGAYVGEDAVISKVKSESGVKPTKEDFTNACTIINSVFPQNNNVVEIGYDMRAGSYFMSNYGKNSLNLVLREVNTMN